MSALTAATLLVAWERALSQSLTQRALTFLALACPETPPERLAMFSIGERDAQLLSLRELAFGSQLTGMVACPACAEQLEVNFTVSNVRVPPPMDISARYTLTNAGCEVEFRLPNGEDLAVVTPDVDCSANKRRLLERCLLSAQRNGQAVSVDELPAEILTAVSEHMAVADPQADVQLPLTCSNCGHSWQAPLDIASYLWTEISAWATRLLREIHTLASVYGWREADILMLSQWRRQAYLEMING